MEIAGFWLSVVGLLIAIGSFVFSIYKYHKHEERLNEQQSSINNYMIKKLEEEELATKQADIRGSIARDTKSSILLVVSNYGQSNAMNVNVEAISSMSGLLTNGFEEIELLNPGHQYGYRITLADGHVKTIIIRYTWRDEYSSSRQRVEHLQID